MPTYEYLCEANGRVLEVQHKMAERVTSWGELCERLGIAAGKTPITAPVTKLMSSSFVSGGRQQISMNVPACGPTGCSAGPCGSAACEI